MAKPMSVSIRFNGDTEIRITPYEGKDKELLGHAIRGNTIKKTTVAVDGSVIFTLGEEAPKISEAVNNDYLAQGKE